MDFIVTYLEMPLTDGAYLTKKIRGIKGFDDISIIDFSSMASKEMKNKIKVLGVDSFVSKSEFSLLIDILNKLLLEKQKAASDPHFKNT